MANQEITEQLTAQEKSPTLENRKIRLDEILRLKYKVADWLYPFESKLHKLGKEEKLSKQDFNTYAALKGVMRYLDNREDWLRNHYDPKIPKFYKSQPRSSSDQKVAKEDSARG